MSAPTWTDIANAVIDAAEARDTMDARTMVLITSMAKAADLVGDHMSAREAGNISVGSISTGTLRTADLLPTLADELERVTWTIRDIALARKARAVDSETEEGHELVNDLCDRLGELAPDYVRFGTHEGDGADFGWWPDGEGIAMALHRGDRHGSP